MDHNRPQKIAQKLLQSNMSLIGVRSSQVACLDSSQIHWKMEWMRYAPRWCQGPVLTICPARIYLGLERSTVDPDEWHKEGLEWPCLRWWSFIANWVHRAVIQEVKDSYMLGPSALPPLPIAGARCKKDGTGGWRRRASFLMITIITLLPSFMEGRVSYITAFNKGSEAKRFDLMGSPAKISRDSSSSCLRRCWYSGLQIR